MSKYIGIIKEDVKAACKALKKEDFHLMNIFANRITSNAYLIDEKTYSLPGVLLKEIASDFLRVQRNKGNVAPLKTYGENCCEKIGTFIRKDEIQTTEIWKTYFEYKNIVKRLISTQIEQDIYTENTEFCNLVIDKLVSDMQTEELEKAFTGKTVLIKGVINEIGRVNSMHGITPSQLSFQIILKMLDRNVDYHLSKSQNIDEEDEIKELLSHANKLLTFWKKHKTSPPEDIYSEATEILADLTFLWRKNFILNLEIVGGVIQAEQRQELLPPDAKKKLGETIVSAIQKEVTQ